MLAICTDPPPPQTKKQKKNKQKCDAEICKTISIYFSETSFWFYIYAPEEPRYACFAFEYFVCIAKIQIIVNCLTREVSTGLMWNITTELTSWCIWSSIIVDEWYKRPFHILFSWTLRTRSINTILAVLVRLLWGLPRWLYTIDGRPTDAI